MPMQKTIIKSLLLIIAFTFAFSANYIFAVWTGPTQAPPGGNTPTPVHVGTTPQAKDGALSLEALAVFGNALFLSNVGIGTASPSQKLDVAGGIEIGNTSNPTAGTIRWTGTDFEGYMGTEWKSLTASSVTNTNINQIPFYGTSHTKQECINAGGELAIARLGGTDFTFCKFQGNSCVSGWTRYQDLGSTRSNSCSPEQATIADQCGYATRCTTSNHDFKNISTETCSYYSFYLSSDTSESGPGPGCRRRSFTCSATLTDVGCY